MYFKSVKTILDQSIADFSTASGKPVAQIYKEIGQHISDTSVEYRNPDPDIDYFDPLCRLGYLYMHAGVNATLFERTIQKSDELKTLIRSRADQHLHICAVGGGPGTELLGLFGFLSSDASCPKTIDFIVLDQVPEWAESWYQLAAAAQNELRSVLSVETVPPTLSRSFQTMNVVEAASYQPYAWLFKEYDVWVFNYLVSENKVHLPAFGDALDVMVAKAKDEAYFVFIDRLERETTFRADLKERVEASGLAIAQEMELGGCVDESEDVFGNYPSLIGRRPRRWYRTYTHRHPTAFAIVAQKI